MAENIYKGNLSDRCDVGFDRFLREAGSRNKRMETGHERKAGID